MKIDIKNIELDDLEEMPSIERFKKKPKKVISKEDENHKKRDNYRKPEEPIIEED